MEKILVFGSTGTVGRPLTEMLVARGNFVRAVSRFGAATSGAQGARFDYGQPDGLADLFDDITAAYVLLPAGYVNVSELVMPIVETAIERKVKVVFQSVLGVDADDDIPYRRVEIKLIKSGIPNVILRPNWFADNFHTFWKPGIAQGLIALPAGEGKSSFIDARDIAACAAEVLATTRFDGQAFNLTGPVALSYAQAAFIISKVIGQPVEYADISDEDFIRMLSSAGAADDYARFLASIFHPVRQGWTSVVTDDVETLTGKRPRSLPEYATDHASGLKA